MELLTDSSGYQLSVPVEAMDSLQFRSAIEEAETAELQGRRPRAWQARPARWPRRVRLVRRWCGRPFTGASADPDFSAVGSGCLTGAPSTARPGPGDHPLGGCREGAPVRCRRTVGPRTGTCG